MAKDLTNIDHFNQARAELDRLKANWALVFDREHYWGWFEITGKLAAAVIAETC